MRARAGEQDHLGAGVTGAVAAPFLWSSRPPRKPGQHRPRRHLDAPHLEPRRGDVPQRGGAVDARWTVGGRAVKMGSHCDPGREERKEREDLDLGTGAAAAWEENRYARARVLGSGFVRWVGELGMGGEYGPLDADHLMVHACSVG
jgi:hypothetical protein